MNSTKADIANTFKHTMRELPCTVAILTASVGKRKRGITIGSFTSLSLSPPLISFNIDRDAQIHDLITRATHFAIHLPRPGHFDLCDHFSNSGLTQEEQFDAVSVNRSAFGNPILGEVPTVIECRAYNQLKAGDHTIVIGEAVNIEGPNKNIGVLYQDRSYRVVGRKVAKEEPKIKQVGS